MTEEHLRESKCPHTNLYVHIKLSVNLQQQ